MEVVARRARVLALVLVAAAALVAVRALPVVTLPSSLRVSLGLPFPDARANHSVQGAKHVHRNNWAVVVDSSRFWYNYRHMANALGIYRVLRDLGVPEDHIVLMMADDAACNARNGFPGQVFMSKQHERNVYGSAIQVDYRGPDVTVENVLRLLEGRVDRVLPANKRLDSDETSNVLVYFTGHGGQEFFKFQDREELLAKDFAESLVAMAARGRFRELLVMFDTCQADSMINFVHTENVFAVTSALTGESSYSYLADGAVGLAIVDRFTYHTCTYINDLMRQQHSTAQKVHASRLSNTNMGTYLGNMDPVFLNSNATARTGLLNRTLSDVLLTDFFANAHTPTYIVPPRLVTEEWF